MMRRLCALALTAAGALALVVAELLTREPVKGKAAPPSPHPRATRRSVIVQPGSYVALDVDSYRYTKGGVA